LFTTSDVPAAPDAPVALVAVAESSLHPLSAALPTAKIANKAIPGDPNPRLALVIKTPELCDPDRPGLFR
jgi:hypothetical protein